MVVASANVVKSDLGAPRSSCFLMLCISALTKCFARVGCTSNDTGEESSMSRRDSFFGVGVVCSIVLQHTQTHAHVQKGRERERERGSERERESKCKNAMQSPAVQTDPHDNTAVFVVVEFLAA